MIETNRLIIRTFRDDDADALYRIKIDSQVMKFCPDFLDVDAKREDMYGYIHDNSASRRTAEKSGFRLFEKRTVYDYQYNRYCDDYFYFRRYWSGCTLKDRYYGDSPYYGRSTSDQSD